MSRRRFLSVVSGAAGGALALGSLPRLSFAAGDDRPNVLLITADDMGWDAAGVCGCRTLDITPSIDRLAAEGMRFERAHVTVAVCQPCREVLMTGCYPHRIGVMGFDPIKDGAFILQEPLKKAGYVLGILGKVTHLQPKARFPWDFEFDEDVVKRDPKVFYAKCREFFGQAARDKRPFFMMANSHDPHRPFGGPNDPRGKPSRVIKPEEVQPTLCLPDLPEVRQEYAEYMTAVHRCDDTVGEILRALKESGLEGNTLVMFLSDNGMSFPFAKSNCYLNSTRTPWIVRWPGKVKPGVVDRDHFISGIDFTPTVLEVAGLQAPEGLDGRSFAPILTGAKQPGRETIFTVYGRTSGGADYTMRAVQDRRFGYIFNAWSNGKTVYQAEPLGGRTFKAMQAAGANDPKIAERVKFLQYRVPEELYDYEKDPNALVNLVGDPKCAGELARLRAAAAEVMTKTQDPALAAFRRQVKT